MDTQHLLNPFWVSGFVDGEGCFYVGFNQRASSPFGLEIRLSFSISQHKRSLEVLEKIHRFWGCGGLRFSKRDQTYRFEVRNFRDLCGKILPHFEEFPLHTAKALDFQRFKQICGLVEQNRHRTPEGMREIVLLAYGMNSGLARKNPMSTVWNKIPGSPPCPNLSEKLKV